MRKKPDLSNPILKMCQENNTFTKEILDFMFSSMKGVMTLANKNFKWGHIKNEDWEDAYSDLYLNMSRYIGKPLKEKTDVFSYLGRATAKYLFDSGKSSVRSKSKNLNLVYKTDIEASLKDIYGIDYSFEGYLVAKEAVDMDFNGGDINADDKIAKSHLAKIFPNDKYKLMPMVYDGFKYRQIAKIRGLDKDYVGAVVNRMRRQYMKSKTYGKEEDIYC